MVTVTLVPLTVAPSAGVVKDALSGVGPFCTTIVLLVDPVLPVASRTLAVSTVLPLGTVVVSHGIDTGPVLLVVWLPTTCVPTDSV